MAAKLGQKFARQQRNVLLALAQRRHKKRHYIEPVKQIFAEIALGNLFFEVLVRRGDQAHIHAQRLRAAHRRKHLVIKSAQHLGLRLEAHVAHFVQKKRPSVGALQCAALFRRTARLRAMPVAEKFCLDVRFGNGRAVQFDKDAIAAQALGMNGARDQFLAGARFAVDQHAAIGRRHEPNLLPQRL